MKEYKIPTLPLSVELENKPILKQLNLANKQLAELKGLVQTIPNESILINSLTLQEAKDSSEVENIVTTHDDLYKTDLDVSDFIASAAAKEVMNYREAIQVGFQLVRKDKLITNNIIKEVQKVLDGNTAGFRKVPGTTLKNSCGNTIYTPPQDGLAVERLMSELEQFINTQELCNLDPLIKLAVIHHQFESIHPFYDGNGRTGRIVSILFLVANDLLDLPILYLSRYITHNKGEYYRLLQAVRENEENEAQWQEWVIFILRGIEETAKDTIVMVKQILRLMAEYKHILRPIFGRQYRHDLLNNLFSHPYTKIEYTEQAMQVRRKTAAKYLDMIVETGLLEKVKIKRSNYFINKKLVDILMNHHKPSQEGNA